MKKEPTDDDCCCDMRGMLSFLILFLISKKPMHGQELADELEKRKGVRPSPGTIYPALKMLKQQGFIKEQSNAKVIVYVLTPTGEKALKAAKQKFCRAFMDII